MRYQTRTQFATLVDRDRQERSPLASGHYHRSRVFSVPPRQAAVTDAAFDGVHMWLVLAQFDRRIRSTAASRIKQELRPLKLKCNDGRR